MRIPTTKKPLPIIKPVDMVDILRGTSKPGTAVAAKAPQGKVRLEPNMRISKTNPDLVILDRVVRIDPKFLPKGMGTETSFMKSGKIPAEGEGGTTTFMKSGKTPAEGEAHGGGGGVVALRIKDGRPMAESDPNPIGGGAGYGSSSGSSGATGSGSSETTSGGSSLSYAVDSSSGLSTDSVRFRKGSTQLADNRSFEYLQNLSEALRDPRLANDRFVVEGHASSDGSASSNLTLSQQRANMIFDFLTARGIDPSRLLSVGHGEAHARYSSSQPEYLLAQDRRVIVYRLAE